MTLTDIKDRVVAAAAHKLSRLLAKDPVTSPLRAPFTSYQGTQGPAELKEEVRGQDGRKTVVNWSHARSAPASGWLPGSARA
jgi:hypothetical protein